MSSVQVNDTTALCNPTYVTPGMPELDMSGKQLSFFEFWPAWAMYLPVVMQSLILAARHRSLTLPLIANPGLPLSGMVGVEKSKLMAQAAGDCQQAILPWFRHTRTNAELDSQAAVIHRQMKLNQLNFPLVCKPDIGCRGNGVKLVHDTRELMDTLDYYPPGEGMLLQALSSWEPEAGVFYIRQPDEPRGRIISLALKYSPYVVGDGKSTLRELIEADPRAGQLQHLYLQRHGEKLNSVVAKGEAYRLIFAASHSRGAIFRNGKQHITPRLSARIDALMKDIPEFYYGRLDIKFRDIAALERGDTIEIVEINSASSEPLHIWDRNTAFSEALQALLFQYRALFQLGAKNRKRGFRPPGLRALLAAWKKERALTQSYPETD